MIMLPHEFTPRKYQIPMLQARKMGYLREIYILHRRAGKDLTAINDITKAATERIGTYNYFFPTAIQARKVIWKGMTGGDPRHKPPIPGRRFLSYIPDELIAMGNKGFPKVNSTEMSIELINGSIIQFIGTDDFDAARGTNCVGAVFSEFAHQDPRAWEVIEPILLENDGWAKFLYTPNGRNNGYNLWNFAQDDPEWFTMLRTIDQTFREDGSPVITLAQIESLRRRKVDEAFIQQEYYCFPSDTDIICQDEVKFIKDVKVGDFVLTHSNRYRKVKQLNKRKYQGKLIRIKTTGNRKDIVCTPEHPIRICNDGVNNKWIKAQHLTLTDRLTFPKLLLKKQKIISEDLIKLLSWYIAEGSSGKGNVQYTLHEDENDFIEEILGCAGRLGYHYFIIWNKDNHTKTISINSIDLMEFLIQNCGSGASNKKIPFNLIAGYEQKVYEILINGDGCRRTDKDMYSTVSKTLAYQVQLLAHQLGYGAGILIVDAKQSVILGRKVSCKTSYNVNIYKEEEKRNKSYYYHKHKYNVTVPIKSIHYITHDNYVYNLEVMYDNSYTANGRVVHNCSFDYGTAGAYYARIMNVAWQEKRIKNIPFDTALPVHTAWDVGVDDATAIIFFQKLPGEYHIIDYYENTGEGISHYAQILQRKQMENGYVYGNHYGPHDLKARVFAADGKPQIVVAKEHGIIFQLVPRLSLQDGIEAVRNLIPKCYFDRIKTATLVEHLENYSKSYSKLYNVWSSTPRDDEHIHGADAMRMMGIAEKSDIVLSTGDYIKQQEEMMDYVKSHSDPYVGY